MIALSPDGRTAIQLEVLNGRAYYSVTREGRTIIDDSKLGFLFNEREPMNRGFTVLRVTERQVDESWEPVWGTDALIENRCHEVTATLVKRSGLTVDVTIRAYDDGVALRCFVPDQEGFRSFEMVSEETEFRLTGDHTTWWIPADFDSYEHIYRETRLAELEAVATPVTMRTEDGLYMSIHEANLTDYAGMTLRKASTALAFECDLVPWPDGIKVRGDAPLVTPWRTIQISDTPGGLIESHIIENLNEPCAMRDHSWIQPMKYVGIWWGMHIGKDTWHQGDNHGATSANTREMIDFAAEHGIGGVLVEGWNTGWSRWGSAGAFDYTTPYPDFDLEGLAAYAEEKGVALIGHHETGGDIPTYEERVEEAFALYERLGIRAVKTGYAGGIFPRGQHHHGQWMVRHYRSIVRKAAEHHIMLDVHEPIKPTGISRTWPNMMTREGVRGMEYNAWSDGNPPEHTTILPFTRMLAGPLDYTPGIFDLTFDGYKPNNRVHTTLAKQLALYVVLESPLQMAADLIENYENHSAFAFIRAVPCDWDETRVLDAAIGDHVTIVRRRGREWFLGSITDEEPRTLTFALDFLDHGVAYEATVYSDGHDADWLTNPLSHEIRTLTVDATDTLEIGLAAGGGQAVCFVPAAR
jgi:alpha-glucosidase